MRISSLLLVVLLFLASCTTNYETSELYGTWKDHRMTLTLNEDSSAEILLGGNAFGENVEWRDAIGNTLEFTSNGKVILDNVTVKGVSKDTLTLELRPLMSRREIATEIYYLVKVN